MNLKPMNLGEILDNTFSMYKAQRKAYMTVSALLVLIFAAGALIVAGVYSAMGSTAAIVTGSIFFIAVLAANISALTGIIHLASEQLAGRSADVKTALVFGFRKAGVQLAGAVLYGIAIIFGSILFILPGLYLANAFILFMQVNALEATGPWEGLKRSRQLSKGSWWRIAVIIFLVGMLVGVLSFILQLPLSILVEVLNLDEFSKLVVGNVISTAVGSLFMPFTGIAYTLLYYDLRVRKENFDLHSAVGEITGATQL